MKKKKNKKIKNWIITGVLAVSYVFIIIAGIAGLLYGLFCFLNYENRSYRSKLVAKYSDDNNYQKYTGIITGTEHIVGRCYFLYFDELLAEDGQTYSKPKTNKSGLDLSIFANNRELVWERLQPEVGLEISFIGPLYPTSMGVKPIVQITARGEEILSYEEGKAAVVEWAKKQW